MNSLMKEKSDKKTYEDMMKALTDVNLENVIEIEDNTDLSGELACAGGSCEVR